MHVKVHISEKRGDEVLSSVEDYRVLGMYTKTYNKWFVSEQTKQAWKKGMETGKVRVFMRMIVYDHSVGKFKDVKPQDSVKWGKRSIFVLCDAGHIVDVVEKLSTN